MGFFDKFLAPFQTLMKSTVESYIRLETADDERTFAAKDGSLVSVLRVDGSRQIIGEDEYKHLIESATIKIGARFDRPGHAWQIVFVRDPERINRFMNKMITPSRVTARNTDMNLDDLFQERVNHLSKFLMYEECFFVLWTRPSVLTKSEIERSVEDRKNIKWVNAAFAQFPLAGIEALRTRHKSFISAIISSLDELGIGASVIETHEALRYIRNNIYPSKVSDNWKPCLPGDPIPPRAPMDKVDMSDILWPPISAQLAVGDVRYIESNIIQIGDMLWAGADMTLGPMDPSPFPMLLNRLFEAKIPYRISFMIEGGGAHSIAFKAQAATMLSVTNPANKQIKYSLEGLQALARSEPVVKLRISIATWSRRDQRRLLEDRMSVLTQSFESWGYSQVSDASGDGLDCVMSSAVGIHCGGTAPVAIAPMYEVMKMLPWQRPSSPFDEGSIMLRTPDGKLWPYQTGSSLTTTWFDLIFAQPGAGKSVLMNSLNLGTILTPGLSKLPYVAVIDIGPSSSGLISLVKEALPPERQHEAGYYRLQMSHKYAINPFDTQLGMRYPLIDERSYLIELMTLLCTPPGYTQPYDGIQQLCGMVIDEMYRWRDDTQSSAEPRPYLPRIDERIDEAIQQNNIHLPTDPYWWDVVDKLFDAGDALAANMAQRHAVPLLTDAIAAARKPQIRTLLEETQIGTSAENVINAFERMLTSAIREYPILASVTQFDIADTRICSLDLMDVSPQGDDTADRQTAIMYMLARNVLVRSWWLGPETLAFIPEKYRHFHEMRLQDMAETPKRLCFDEFHRTSSSSAVRGQVIRDVREGRKRGVQIVLASQLLDDFDDDMVDLATGVWVLGAAVSDAAVDGIQNRFGLTQTARNVIRFNLTGPKSSGAPALLVLGTKQGRYEQHLINTLGPIELWALSTTAEDVAVRTRLYSRMGASRARQVLAANFPGGSARPEIKRRVIALSEEGDEGGKAAAVSAVIDGIVEELVEAGMKKMVAPDS
ncbi:MAG: type IV secretion protein IcmB [Alphaproteobacteria bacterium]